MKVCSLRSTRSRRVRTDDDVHTRDMVVVHEAVEPQCRALNLSDARRCVGEATAHDGLFCRFHARQCFGLYRGYKRRNAELDALAQQEPAFLRSSGTPLANQTSYGISCGWSVQLQQRWTEPSLALLPPLLRMAPK